MSFFTTRSVGIEIENTMSHTRLAEFRGALTGALAAGRVSQREPGYYHSDGRTWDIKTDASCGGEVASPAMRFTEEGHLPELKTTCDLMRTMNVAVNANCGLHVHVDVSDFTRVQQQRLIALWLRYEPFFFSLTPPSRRNNHYCQPMRTTEFFRNTQTHFDATTVNRALKSNSDAAFRRGISTLTGERKQALNLTSLWMSGRIEFRLHSGTVNYEKIRRWTLWLLALVERAKGEDVRRSVASPLSVHQASPVRRQFGMISAHVIRALNVTSESAPSVYAPMLSWANERRARFTSGGNAVLQTGTEMEASE